MEVSETTRRVMMTTMTYELMADTDADALRLCDNAGTLSYHGV